MNKNRVRKQKSQLKPIMIYDLVEGGDYNYKRKICLVENLKDFIF